MENGMVEDPGRADYVPKKPKKKHTRKFKDGDKVWMSVSGSPDIIVWVKKGRYDEERDGWVYNVQEQDKEGAWEGVEVRRREKALKRA
ncbi:hypothetical protein IFR05_009491 [Cadophora sp. M221]|nr:hypothetical protein IFR05_009491 [Cadophora sp. M221]